MPSTPRSWCCNGCCGCCPGRKLPSKVFGTASGGCGRIQFSGIPMPFAKHDDETEVTGDAFPNCGSFNHPYPPGADSTGSVVDPILGWTWTIYPSLSVSCDHLKAKTCNSYALSPPAFTAVALAHNNLSFSPMAFTTGPYPTTCTCRPFRLEYDGLKVAVGNLGQTFIFMGLLALANIVAVDLCTNTWYTTVPNIQYSSSIVIQE